MPHIDRSTEDILEVATEALFNRKRTMYELLAHAEKVYRRKLKTPEDCDDMLGIINNEAEKFNECIRAFQKTKKKYEKGEDGAKIISTEEKAAIALLKKNCQKLESSLGDFVQGNHITGKELEDFKAYIVGLRKIVTKIKKERVEIAKEGLSYDEIYELIYAPEGADSDDDDKKSKKSDDDDEDSDDSDDDDKKSKKKKKDSTDDSEEDFDGEPLDDDDEDNKKSKKKSKDEDDDDDDDSDDDKKSKKSKKKTKDDDDSEDDDDEDSDDDDDKKSKKKSKDDDDDEDEDSKDDDKDSGEDWPDFSLGGDDDDDKKSKKKSKDDDEDDDEDEDEDSEDDDKKDKKKKKKKDDEEEEVEESFNHSDKDMDIAFEMARDFDMSFSEALDIVEEGYEEDFMAKNRDDSEKYELAEFLRENCGYTIENAMDFAFDLAGDDDDDEVILPSID